MSSNEEEITKDLKTEFESAFFVVELVRIIKSIE